MVFDQEEELEDQVESPEFRRGEIAWFPSQFKEACQAIYGEGILDEMGNADLRPEIVVRTTMLSHYFKHFFRKYERNEVAHHMLRFENIVQFLWMHRDELAAAGLGRPLDEGFAAHPDLIEALCELRYNVEVIPEVQYEFDYDEVVGEANRLRNERHR